MVVLAAAGGAAGGLLPDHRPAPPHPNPPPAELLAAAERERALIADLDATTGGTPALREVLLRARADHAAHLATFRQLLDAYDGPGNTPTTSPGTAVPSPAPSGSRQTRGTPRTAAQLRAAEEGAAALAARAAAATTGRVAVLLASVSASESSHAALIR